MKELSPEFGITKLCPVLGVSRSAYYSWLKGRTYVLGETKKEVSETVARIFHSHKRMYGTRRIREELWDEGHQVGRFQVRNRMREQGLLAIQPKSFVPQDDPVRPSPAQESQPVVGRGQPADRTEPSGRRGYHLPAEPGAGI